MNKQELSDFLKIHFPENKITDDTQYTEMTVPPEELQKTAAFLKNDPQLSFDYLISVTAVDFLEKMTVVYHLDSTKFRHLLVLKTNVTGRENPSVDTVSELWPTALFQEREVFDLFGIRFNGHRDLRRLFMEDDYGYPLRKDFQDEVNIIRLNA